MFLSRECIDRLLLLLCALSGLSFMHACMSRSKANADKAHHALSMQVLKSINHHRGDDGLTPLHLACLKGDEAAVT